MSIERWIGGIDGAFNFFGYDATLPDASGRAYRVAFAYATLPDSFPAGATLLLQNAACPLVFLRRSA